MFRLLKDAFVLLGIVLLALIVALAKGEINELQGKSKAQEKVIKRMELQLNEQEWTLFLVEDDLIKCRNKILAAEKLGDRILDTCLTDGKRSLKKKGGN